ncbi:MAG: hypothetical protein OXD32_02035 [Endozoicomonadaceae bacterium]|nr:hypothetical protein [Endozoicomonadaceae bacterium]
MFCSDENTGISKAAHHELKNLLSGDDPGEFYFYGYMVLKSEPP